MFKQSKGAPGFLRLGLLVLGAALLGPLCFGGRVSGATAGTWTQIPSPIPHPLARAGHSLVYYAGGGVLFGGESPNPTGPGTIALSDIWMFQSGAGTFSRLNSTTPIPSPRYGHAATVQVSRMYSFFGHGSDGGLLDEVWYYDFPLVCWEPLHPLSTANPVPRAEHSANTLDADFILVFGGRDGNGGLLDDLWRFEPFAGQWVQRASFPGGGRCGHVSALLGGKLYVLGGTSAAGAQNDVWAYDPAANGWSQLTSDGDVPGPFTGSAGGAGDFERTGSPQIMVVGGKDGQGVEISSAYTVSIDPNGHVAHWKLQTPHPAGFQAAAVGVTPAGGPANAANLLLFGGSQAGQLTDTGWIFSRPGSTPPTADLSGKWVTLTAKSSGKGAKLRWKLTGSLQLSNKGAARSGASSVRFLLSADGTPHAGDPLLKQVKVAALVPGRTVTAKLSATLPPGQAVSGRYVIAVLDALGQVRESDETNNAPAFGPLP